MPMAVVLRRAVSRSCVSLPSLGEHTDHNAFRRGKADQSAAGGGGSSREIQLRRKVKRVVRSDSSRVRCGPLDLNFVFGSLRSETTIQSPAPVFKPVLRRSTHVVAMTLGTNTGVTKVLERVEAKEGIKDGLETLTQTTKAPLKATFLEGNSWHWLLAGVSILVDPIIGGPFDFGIPYLYQADKLHLKDLKAEDLPPPDLILLTQHLDDHCNLRTLRALSQQHPDVSVIAPTNARSILDGVFKKITFLDHNEVSTVEISGKSQIEVRGTAGARVGPPWQHRENGYIVSSKDPDFSVYWEPHCMYEGAGLERLQADAVLTPYAAQKLPKPVALYELVGGNQKAVDLCKMLKAKYVLPIDNGDLDAKGPLNYLVEKEGTIESFKELMQDPKTGAPGCKVIVPEAGKPVAVE